MPNIKLPDYDDMMAMAESIRNAVLVKEATEHVIKSRESEIYRIASADSKYFISGKPPATSYIKATYEYPGLEGELLEKRKQLFEATAYLEMLKLQFEIMKMQVELYRTESANRRLASL